ncbi:OX-2 membrane glycoprotein isoform X2 [Struthio camelus]|uniref:OX-2 membrane glycoprotein isoform X2 n=1 Tax=Struthio camelus TaxID=8801 RepID=UPI003603FE02
MTKLKGSKMMTHGSCMSYFCIVSGEDACPQIGTGVHEGWSHGLLEGSVQVMHRKVQSVQAGGNVTFSCRLITNEDALQVTWQKEMEGTDDNIATYSTVNGQKIVKSYGSHVSFALSELQASAISLQGVTFQDEGCYKCIFNTFPSGAVTGRMCLKVYAISDPKVEAKLIPSPDKAKGNVKVVEMSCSATGKPAPKITWQLPSTLQQKPREYHVRVSNQTVTVISNFTLTHSKVLQEYPVTCMIQHPSLNVTLALPTDSLMQGQDSTIAPVVATAFGVLVPLISLLLLGFLFWHCLRQLHDPERHRARPCWMAPRSFQPPPVPPAFFNSNPCSHAARKRQEPCSWWWGQSHTERPCHDDLEVKSGLEEAVKSENIVVAALGGEADLYCNFTLTMDVLQVTWQKRNGSLFENIASYSQNHGLTLMGSFQKKARLTRAGLKASVITMQNLTLEDESYYRCIFNVFPHGSLSKDICLNVQTVSELIVEYNPHLDTEGLLTAVCSATGKPPPQITWLGGEDLDETSKVHHVQNANGTVTVASRHTFPAHQLQGLACLLDHPQGRKMKAIHPEKESEGVPKSTIIVAVLAAVFFMSLMLYITKLIHRRRAKIGHQDHFTKSYQV